MRKVTKPLSPGCGFLDRFFDFNKPGAEGFKKCFNFSDNWIDRAINVVDDCVQSGILSDRRKNGVVVGGELKRLRLGTGGGVVVRF